MKKWISTVLVAALCAALSICLIGCSADSEGATDGVTTDSVAGDWEVVAIEAGDETLTGTTLDMIGQGTTFGFKTDGSCYADTDGNVVDGTWKLSGSKITMTFGDDELTGDVTPDNITVGGMTLEPLQQSPQG